jgi:NADPH-dependent 2,4-dienoyl-CoA reductase/sulfur reductase-like enzyme
MKAKRDKKIVILGNGGAAAHAVMAARTAGFSGEIHMVSDSDRPAFNPMLAPYYLKGALAWKHCFPFGSAFYQRFRVNCHFGSAIERLDADQKTVLLQNREKLHYDKCLIATGASSVTPPVPGLENSPYAFPLRTADHTLRIEKAITSAKKVIVLGASLVGVKVAEILTKHNAAVTLLDVAEQMMPNGAHPHTAQLLRSYFELHNIDVRLGCSLEGMEGGDGGVCCFLPGSIMEEADFVAVCAGIRPNLLFLDSGQVAIGQAVVVDTRMQTSASDLYAAGDVCQGLNRQSGQSQWLGTWGNACYQGRTAGLNMAGVTVHHAGMVPQHISPFFDWTYAQLGDVNRQGEGVRVDIHGDPDREGGCSLLVYEDDILVGANLINCADNLGSIKKAITQKLPWNRAESMPGWH